MNIFLSHPITRETPTYGNRDTFESIPKSRISSGATANTDEWRFSINHFGTHVDVPLHFIEGAKSITDYGPQDWIFQRPEIIDVPCSDAKLILPKHIPRIPEDSDFVMIRTGFERYRADKKYWDAYPALHVDTCVWLRENLQHLKALGIDYISMTSPCHRSHGKPAHLALLEEREGQSVLIVEDMHLRHVSGRLVDVLVSPLMVQHANGAPVTVMATEVRG